jgi:hypothetical protein
MTRYACAYAVPAIVLAALAAPAAAQFGGPPPAPITGTELKAKLDAKSEVPGPGDTAGSGTFMVWVDTKKNSACYTLMVRNVQDATMAHIHKGISGVAGNVVVPLDKPNGYSHDCTQIDPKLAADLVAHPDDYYVNVHSKAFPKGAIRGQLAMKPAMPEKMPGK